MASTKVLLDANGRTPLCSAAAAQVVLDPSLLPQTESFLFSLVGARENVDTLVYTSSAAEAVCQVLWSIFFEVSKKEGKTQIITSSIEDMATLQMLQRLEEMGCIIKIVHPGKDGRVDKKEIEALLSPRTALVSLKMGEGLTGVLQPFEEIAALCQKHHVKLHLDANYGVGKIPFSFAELQADYLTFGGEKIHGPVGIGALFAKRGSPLISLICGSKGLRGGEIPLLAKLQLGKSAQQSLLFLDQMILEGSRLRALFEKLLCEKIRGAKVCFSSSLRLPNTSAISFLGAHAEAIVYLLSPYASSLLGGDDMPHLHKIVPGREGECAVSFSLSRSTTQEEILYVVEKLEQIVPRLQAVSKEVFFVSQ